MSIADNTFSMSTMSDALPHIRFSRGISGFHSSSGLLPTRLRHALKPSFNLMTSGEGCQKQARVETRAEAPRDIRRRGRALPRRILRRFLHVMTDKYASYVARRAMAVFDQTKKYAMYEHISTTRST
ncbi:unnamed protein product [Microthlaspi erraticum]|uniref:PUM-HD domain-containing protein n=1 Tax=Microthlaspi erraticum TaxID=1685480 RepID=A0A6D2IU74_9BRAS|nr:unnamed protein product [Microthlaspi erraticum]